MQLLRNLVNRKLTWPSMDAAGAVLANHLPPAVLSGFRKKYPMASSSGTASARHASTHHRRLKTVCGDGDADFWLFGSDNYGRSQSGKRYETITHWLKQFSLSRLGGHINDLLGSFPASGLRCINQGWTMLRILLRVQ